MIWVFPKIEKGSRDGSSQKDLKIHKISTSFNQDQIKKDKNLLLISQILEIHLSAEIRKKQIIIKTKMQVI